MTFLEILITVSILAVIAVISAVSWFGYQRTAAVDAASREILNMLQEAQGNAIAQRDDSRWGVRVMNEDNDSSWAEIFYGTSYAMGTVARRATFSSYAELSNPSSGEALDIMFEKRTGKTIGGGVLWASYIDDTNQDLKVARQGAASGGGGGTIMQVQKKVNDYRDNPPSVTLDATATTGNLLIATVGGRSGGGTFQPAGWSTAIEDASGDTAAVYYKIATGSESTINFSYTAGRGGVIVTEWSNSAGWGSDPFDQTNLPAPCVLAWTCSTGGVTPSAADALLIGVFGVGNANESDVRAYNNSFSQDGYDCSGGCGGTEGAAAGVSRIVSSVSSYSTTLDATGSSAGPPDVQAGIVSFVSGGGGGGGGGGCTNATNPDDWICETVDATGNLAGEGTALRVDRYGTPWVAYQRVDGTGSNADLKVARYVGSLGNCDDTGGSDAWQCEIVDTNSAGSWPSVAFDASGNPWVTYQAGGDDLSVARYTGTGSESSCPGGNTNWDCSAITTAGNVGDNSSIAFDSSGEAWVSFVSTTAGEVRVAHYTGVGSETSCGAAAGENNWECWTVGSGSGTRIAIDSGGTSWVAYRADPDDFAVAQYVGSGGTCTNAAWDCVTVDSEAEMSAQFGLRFGAQGVPWAAYDDTTGTELWVAQKDNQ